MTIVDPLAEMKGAIQPVFHTWPLVVMLAIVISAGSVWAVPMTNDPQGFHDIPWGTSLSSRQDLELMQADPHITEYLRKAEQPSFGGMEMTSVLYVSIDDQFARVTVRYQGKETHDQLLSFLQGRYGPLDRTPGQFAGGAVKLFAWQGEETAVSLRYETRTDRGIIFFENPSLASRIEGAMAPEQDLGGATY